ncbi:MAG: mechanosensitive ion channel family protein [Endomicrobia bacterium]|nr:mechanosensitive ion channel family protein [Endomicrobiia bacterium]MCL2506955.1 mechanosensitive ion channel family protein [Endomicrobiia bacterium]
MEFVISILNLLKLPEKYVMPIAGMSTILLFITLLYLAWFFFKTISHKYLYSKYFHVKNPIWYKALKDTNFLAAFGYLGAGIIAKMAVNGFFPETYRTYNLIAHNIVLIYFQICILLIANKILSAVMIAFDKNRNIPVKGLLQFLRIFLNFFGVLIILAFLIGKEPTYFISALGIIASVLLIVFKDTILGLTASWQLAMNNMLHIGDWIEMPSHNANGDVIDISLTTVSVQNWDKTIVTIPAYDLISRPFINWRGMNEAGGRRIKRSINIDMQSIRFVDEEMLARLKKFELLKDYLASKEFDIKEYNKTHNIKESIYNGRYLTNIGTFRAYCEAYLKSRSYVNTNFITMVRQLQPGSEGMPLEIYCFTTTTQLIPYENYQSDIFDHLLSVMEAFDLYVFQNPTSMNFKHLVSHVNKREF